MAKSRRKQILINKPFQLKFCVFVCSWIFAISLVFPLIIYRLFDFFMSHISPNPPSGTILAVESVRFDLVIMLVGLEIIFLFVTFLVSLFISHRIAGPLYKLQRTMDETSPEEIPEKLAFRKYDYFPELAESYTKMVERFRGKESPSTEEQQSSNEE